MKYQLCLLCIAITGQISPINLSGLLTDNDQVRVVSQKQNKSTSTFNSKYVNQIPSQSVNLNSLVASNNNDSTDNVTPISKHKKRSMSVDMVNSLVTTDPEYQDAINVLYDQNNAKIYDDYLESISHSFMNYYLAHIKAVKTALKKPKIIDVAGLKSLSVHVTPKQDSLLAHTNLNSLTDIVNITHVDLKHDNMNLSELKNITDISVVPVSTPKKVEDKNLLQLADTKKVRTIKKKKRQGVNLSSIVNISKDSDIQVDQ